MKRYLIATGVGAMVFAGALGSAAALDLNGNPAAQFGESSLICDADGVTVDGLAGETDGVSQSTAVGISDIADTCAGRTIVATVTNSNGTQIRKGFTEVPAGGGAVSIPWSAGAVNVADIDNLRITIG